jgi:hypothetical protein
MQNMEINMSKTPKKEIKIQSDIWLGRIVYSGDNIGHEFSFKFKLGDKIFKLNRTLEYSEINIIYTKLFTNFYTEEQNIELVIEAEENDDIPDTAKCSVVITVDAITKINNVTLPKGLYDLQIPDEPHKLGKLYEKYIPYSKTWFRIKNKANPEIGYYLHYGQASAGCVTVTEVKDSNGKFIDIWTPIYNYLILRRETNKIGIVGTIEIIYKNKVK